MTAVHEYAFDIKLAAVVRMRATSEGRALEAIATTLDAADLMAIFIDQDAELTITEASAYIDDADGPLLFEIDGEEVG